MEKNQDGVLSAGCIRLKPLTAALLTNLEVTSVLEFQSLHPKIELD